MTAVQPLQPTNPVSAQSDSGLPDGWTRRRHVLACAGLLVLYLFLATYCLSRVPLLDPDEPRYATAARNMAEGGSWLNPEFNDEPRYNKPPLFYWLVAISHKVLGSSEVSARVPSILMGLLMLVLTVYAGRRLYDPATAYIGGLVLCTSPLFMALSRTCVIDQTLSTIIVVGLFLFLLRLAGRLMWNPLVLMGGVMGLAFMAKGPAASLVLVVPLVFMLLFARASFGYEGLRRLFPFPAWLLALLLAAGLSIWWYVALWGQIGTDKFSDLLKFEILGRLEGDVHNEPYPFYLYVFPAVFFPWSIALVSSIGSAWQKVDVPMPLGPGDEEQTVRSRRALSDAFLVAWLIGVVVFFTVPKAKLATYVLPAFPAAALLTARFLRRMGSIQEPVQRSWAMLTALLGGVVALGLAALPLFEKLFKQDAKETIQSLPVPLWVIGVAVGLSTCVPWIVVGTTRRYRVVLFVLPAFVVLLAAVGLPVVFGRSEFLNTSRDLSSAPGVQEYARRAKAVYSIGWPEESLVWYVGRGVHGAIKKDRDPKEPLTESLQKALDEHPPGTVLIFVHREKFKRWFMPDRLVRVREIAGNGRVAVLVNEEARK